MEVTINQKFKILFRRIFEENCQISRYHADKLLKCLGDPNDHVAKHLLDTPMFSDLIFHSIGNMQTLSISNKIFTLELVTLLFRNELQFNKLQCQGFDLCMLRSCVVDHLNSKSIEMYVAFIKLVTVLLTHCSGIKLIKSKKPWERILRLSNHRKSAHLSKAVNEHLTHLVWKLDKYQDETTLYEVLRAILKPIHMSEYQTLEIIDIEKEKSYPEPIKGSLYALLAIMSETSQLINSKCLIPILKHCYLIEAPMRKVLVGTRDPDIISIIAQINFKCYFAMASQGCVRAGRSASDFLNEIIACFVNEITKLMRKAMIAPILEFILNVNIFWAKTRSELCSSTFERNGQEHEMEDQFLWHLMLPLITYVTVTLKCTPQEIEEYHTKMGQMLTEHITKSGYRYKTLLQRNDLKKVTIQNLKQIFRMKGLLKAKQAGTLFQSLFYLLQTFMTKEAGDACVVARDENPLQTSDDVKLLSLTLTAIKMLLTEHHITWHDNLEIICLQNILMSLMKQDTWPTKQLLQALDLIELSTCRFLSPDMALLVETRHGSTLCDTAAAMHRYMQHEDWEVRDSALTLLLACTNIAFVKYVPLQKLILKNKLIVLATVAALTDTEYYVQVTALKCLAAAAKVESLWREVLDHDPNVCIYTQLWQILRQSPDGAVRAAAATVLTQVYVNQQTTAQFRASMHRAMAAAALDDIHSEVQLAALDYWSQLIRNHFNDRGMMDGKFPSVTFSKEKRKIIVLDEKEVKRQLAAIMNDLSSKGCLTVLHRCINEEFDIQVMERAYGISNDLVEILTCHNFDKVPESYNCPMDHDQSSESDGMPLDLSFVPDTTAKRDNVIEEIVNTKTSDLIMNLSESSENIDQEIPALPPMKEKTHPNKFLEDFKQTDYATIISNVKHWQPETTDLSCLLDEILGDSENIEMCGNCIE